uniref:Uncharacterized protein n=1 Tax=Laticauda laticaudata TaxID=8630 RepID=A0A8C5RZC5_LATLA
MLVSVGASWASVSSQATQKKPWTERNSFSRSGRQPEPQHDSEPGFKCRGHSTSSERKQSLQKKIEKPVITSQSNRVEQTPELLYFGDEEEFPELNCDSGHSKANNTQLKHAPKMLDDLPENSPINIVQTPIPITTSVPKRAKSQKKKALAAALATAQEYSEISMEQRKLQVCFNGCNGNAFWVSIQVDQLQCLMLERVGWRFVNSGRNVLFSYYCLCIFSISMFLILVNKVDLKFKKKQKTKKSNFVWRHKLS